MASREKCFLMRGRWEIRNLPEAASQSFKWGDPVMFSSGKVAAVTLTGSDPTKTLDMSGVAGIIGFALRAATGTADSTIPVAVPLDESEILLPVDHATPASAITAVTQIGTSYEMGYYDGVFTVRIDVTSAGDVMVVPTEIDTTYPVGEQYGRLWCKVLSAERAFG
mgnify:CR=1 FL=1